MRVLSRERVYKELVRWNIPSTFTSNELGQNVLEIKDPQLQMIHVGPWIEWDGKFYSPVDEIHSRVPLEHQHKASGILILTDSRLRWLKENAPLDMEIGEV